MLKSSQPTTPAPASSQTTPAAKDASKPAKKKQKVVEESSPSVEISLPAGDDQFFLLCDAQLLRDSVVLTTIDCGIGSAFQRTAVQERDARLEE
ncbi:hypothetical protein ACOSQ2_002741 [Xanthoceras sorbifolium]